MVVSDELIDKIGTLAKLNLDCDSKKQAKTDINKMLDYIDILNGVDTEHIENMDCIKNEGNVLREDNVVQFEAVNEIIKLAPESNGAGFVVPKTF